MYKHCAACSAETTAYLSLTNVAQMRILPNFSHLFQITHWQHPRFHAYFPAGNAYASILGDMLSDAIGCVGFSWVSDVYWVYLAQTKYLTYPNVRSQMFQR
jgi:hypothetical protein